MESHQPRGVVRAGLTDGNEVVLAKLKDELWLIGRNYGPEDAAGAEAAARSALSGATGLDEGVTILRATARFQVDTHLTTATIERDADTYQGTLDPQKMGRLRQMLDGSDEAMVMMHLLRHPDDTASVLQMMADARDKDHAVQLGLLDQMLEHNLITDADAQPLRDAVLGRPISSVVKMRPITRRTESESKSAETAPEGPIGPSAPMEPGALAAPEQRFLQGRFPERVRLGENVSLLVRLGLQPGERLEAGLRPLRVPEAGLEIVLLLVNSSWFNLRSPERTVVQVVPRQDSNWAGFELQATREGVHTLQVEAFAGGTGLGGLPIQVSVDATAQTGPSMERSSPAGIAAADPGEVSLLLSYDADQHVYRYRLVDSDGYYSEEAASERLLQPPGQAIEQLVGQLNALARGQETWDVTTTKDWLKGQGIMLWNSFIPQALQREFWQRRDRITQMTIISQGDPVPWELLYPFAPGSQDAGFLVDQFPVARRRYGPRPPGRLELGAADLVLSRDGSPAAAPAEIAALDGLLRSQGLAARHIGDLPSLLQAFRRGDVGLLHFSCHNAFARGAPSASRILLGNQPFEPVFLEQHAGRFAAPLVFLNACRTDGQAPLYTTVEGWASSFLRAGAGAFIGSLWEVSDISASIYAQAFYQAALGGHTLGESARRAREAIRDNPGDPTWLAYALYGDPAATISTRIARTD